MNDLKQLSIVEKHILYAVYKNEITRIKDIEHYLHENIQEEIGLLKEKGLIEVNGENITLTSESLFSVGVSILNDYTYITLCSYSKVVKERKIETELLGNGEKLLQNLSSTILDMVSGVEKKVVGIGVLIIGNVDEDNGISKNSYGLLNVNTNIIKSLEFSTGFPTSVGHNVRSTAACLINKDQDNFVYMKHSPGVGAAFCVDGKIVRGAHGAFAEIGHVAFGDSEEMCRCGKIGCLETVVSDRKLLEQYEKARGIKLVDTATLYDYYVKDQKAKAVMDAAIEKMVKVIDVLYMLYDPKKIILNGGMFDSPLLFQKLKEAVLEKYGKINTEIIHLDSVAEIKRIAAAMYALDNFLINED